MDKQLQQLEELLRGQIAAHEALGSIMTRKAAALRLADRRQLMDCCELENKQVQAIGDLEKQRLQLVADLTLMIQPQAGEPMRLAELAQRLPEPSRGRLLVLRQQLVERMTAVHRQTQSARHATQTLVAHMHGLIQSIGTAMTGVATYGQRGSLPTPALAVSTFSTTA